ncbi:MAG: MBL fold metallo-hydrolase [Verrucomicrobiota bacterium]|nr:MBL fold metallo-hydrolase [Verrucomicrobiota bacterium]
MRFINLTGRNEIGANCYFLEIEDRGFILDAGLHPKLAGFTALPELEWIRDEIIHGILLTHCHLDHIGSLPVVMREHPAVPVYMTQACYQLSPIVLHNSCNVMIKERDEKHIREYPLFGHREVDELLERWFTLRYKDPEKIAGGSIECTLFDAGHVLGSAGVQLKGKTESFFYTGDINFTPQTITLPADFPEESPDVLVIETTRGAQAATEGKTRQTEIERLGRRLKEVFDRGGSVLIPCFALGKQQEVLAILHQIMTQGLIERKTVFFGGLGKQFSQLYDKLAPHTRRLLPDLQFFDDMDLAVFARGESDSIKLGGGKIFAVSAGMMTAPTHSFVIGQRMLQTENNAIFFVGYLDPESPAGLIKAAGRGGKVKLGRDIPEQTVRCDMDSFDLTTHANREDILNYILKVKPKTTILVHGDPTASEWFGDQLDKQNMKWIIPTPGKEYHL